MPANEFVSDNVLKLAASICEKGLRYDLTVPFARYVVMHRDELQMPFKRYQIQPVWRADRPQKGRYREFYQCDADVVGSDSLLNEVELVQLIDTVFTKFGINVQIKLNNRKILAGIAEYIGQPDKIGVEAVNAEMLANGITQDAVDKLQPILTMSGTNVEKLETIAQTIGTSEIAAKGVEETRFILEKIEAVGLKNELQLDLTLARGLNYYTGAIFEVKAKDVAIGSITGGGRYDNLTGIFGMPGLSGVGISFGADRMYDVLNTLDLYPQNSIQATQVLFINFGEAEADYCLPIASQIRAAGISVELYPDCAKMKKQMAYANAKGIPFVVLAGESEINLGKVTLKNMLTGDQQLVSTEELIAIITSKNT